MHSTIFQKAILAAAVLVALVHGEWTEFTADGIPIERVGMACGRCRGLNTCAALSPWRATKCADDDDTEVDMLVEAGRTHLSGRNRCDFDAMRDFLCLWVVYAAPPNDCGLPVPCHSECRALVKTHCRIDFRDQERLADDLCGKVAPRNTVEGKCDTGALAKLRAGKPVKKSANSKGKGKKRGRGKSADRNKGTAEAKVKQDKLRRKSQAAK
jgi:hypothetical protein